MITQITSEKIPFFQKELASISEHISNVINARDNLIKFRRKQGFLRERTSTDEDNRKNGEKYLTSFLFSAMEGEFGNGVLKSFF